MRIDTPRYLTQIEIKAKTSAFLRIAPTRFRLLTSSETLKKHGFLLTKSSEKRLFEITGITYSPFFARLPSKGELPLKGD
ncbi:hypothetical protein [Parabacteroides sp. ZJ-118]|uniref:hypothetical protein n=1 Tax=Parabacteroides sp. ZJ-118 TaxID=2709398 RepID=UPI0013ECE515|nr:hypothetical protein [Parabacteroides sp. ZJ-118]